MGRPKLPRTKEQIAIRLAPGTKARLAALLKTMASRGAAPVRSEVLRQAIERGLAALEADLQGKPAAQRAVASPPAPTPRPAPPTPAQSRTRPAPPPPRIPVPSATRSAAPGAVAPIPGTLADRAWQKLKQMSGGDRNADVPSLPLCKAAWPPNPSRVRDALVELADMGLIELRPWPSGARVSAEERELAPRGKDGAALGLVRLR